MPQGDCPWVVNMRTLWSLYRKDVVPNYPSIALLGYAGRSVSGQVHLDCGPIGVVPIAGDGMCLETPGTVKQADQLRVEPSFSRRWSSLVPQGADPQREGGSWGCMVANGSFASVASSVVTMLSTGRRAMLTRNAAPLSSDLTSPEGEAAHGAGD